MHTAHAHTHTGHEVDLISSVHTDELVQYKHKHTQYKQYINKIFYIAYRRSGGHARSIAMQPKHNIMPSVFLKDNNLGGSQ